MSTSPKIRVIAVFPDTPTEAFMLTEGASIVDGRDFSIGQIQYAIDTGWIVIVDTRDQILNALEDSGIPYYLVYPGTECKDQYVCQARAHKRQVQADLLERFWDELLEDMYRRKRSHPLILGANMALHDVLRISGETLALVD